MKPELKEKIVDFINKIIKGFSAKSIFDSHFIIQQMLKRNSELFYDVVRATGKAKTENVHSQLAKMVEKCDAKKLFKKNDRKSYSENIHGKVSPCTAWVKK